MATQILLKRGFFNIANATTAIATRGELGFNLSTTGSSLYSFPEVFGFDNDGDYLINPVVELNDELLNTPLFDGGYSFAGYLNILIGGKPYPAASTNNSVTTWNQDFFTHGGVAYTVDPYDTYVQNGVLVLSPDKFVMRSGKYYSTAKVKWIPINDKRVYEVGDDPFVKETVEQGGDIYYNANFTIPLQRNTITHILNIGSGDYYYNVNLILGSIIYGDIGEFEETTIYLKVLSGGDIDNAVNFTVPQGYTVVSNGMTLSVPASNQVLKLTVTNLHDGFISIQSVLLSS